MAVSNSLRQGSFAPGNQGIATTEGRSASAENGTPIGERTDDELAAIVAKGQADRSEVSATRMQHVCNPLFVHHLNDQTRFIRAGTLRKRIHRGEIRQCRKRDSDWGTHAVTDFLHQYTA